MKGFNPALTSPTGRHAVFQHHCTSCDGTQLIFPSMLLSLTSTPAGHELVFECWCGATQTTLVRRDGGAPTSVRSDELAPTVAA
jgi:hypothetical protein